MTREEATRHLEEWKEVISNGYRKQVIDMAIDALSADDENRLYIKIYADDEPSRKAEKLYQICNESERKEVAEWLKEYFPSARPTHKPDYTYEAEMVQRFQKLMADAKPMAIRNETLMPTVEVVSARPQWIPCSERLPKGGEHRDDMVLVCYRDGSVRFNTCMNGEWVQGSPIAWMPLPPVYQGE